MTATGRRQCGAKRKPMGLVGQQSLRFSDDRRPDVLHFRLLCNSQCVVDINAEVSQSALQVGMAKQELHRASSWIFGKSMLPWCTAWYECHTPSYREQSMRPTFLLCVFQPETPPFRVRLPQPGAVSCDQDRAARAGGSIRPLVSGEHG